MAEEVMYVELPIFDSGRHEPYYVAEVGLHKVTHFFTSQYGTVVSFGNGSLTVDLPLDEFRDIMKKHIR